MCNKGHDKRIVGRTASNQCAECKRINLEHKSVSGVDNILACSRKYGRRHILNVPVIEAQPGYLCDNCEKPIIHQPHSDHDHDNGEFRGWLCVKCNTALGVIDNVDFLEQLIKYKVRTTKLKLVK